MYLRLAGFHSMTTDTVACSYKDLFPYEGAPWNQLRIVTVES